MLADLHHAMSVRSFRTTDLAAFVNAVRDVDTNTAKELYAIIKDKYPIVLTRNLNKAKAWVRSQCQGMVVFIPLGSDTDETRKREWYDRTFTCLAHLGINNI